MKVALIGPPQSGKSTLFAAMAESGGSHIDVHRADQAHLAVVKVPDDRVAWLTNYYKPKKTTLAELEFVDIPGFDMRDEAGRDRARTHWAALHQCDMLVFVVRAFGGSEVAAYRDRVSPKDDVEELLAEMLLADLEQVISRVEKLEAAIKKPSAKREEQARELDMMKRLQVALESDKPISSALNSQAEGKLLASFGFFSQKPALVVLNCDESANDQNADTVAGLPCLPLSAKIEEEIAQLAPEERKDFLADLGLAASARDRMVRACYQQLNLISFLTAGEDECRAWTIPAGTDAVLAAGKIHSDIARGFIRAETVSFSDLVAAGDMKGVKAAGKARLEGKTYIVQDGDIINFRFAV
jgi:GTP-binding protein YchF